MKLFSLAKFIAFISILYTFPLFAQGTVQGTVRDSITGDALVGANVIVVGTSLGASTDIEGDYKILLVPTGAQIIKISYVGYKSKEIPVTIKHNETLKLNIIVTPDIIKGKEIIVYGQAVGQTAAINQQRASNTIVNVLSEERIQELPDANAAEAIGRLPGVSLQRSGGEANKIVMRGMSDKFSMVTVDGIRMAPTDADSRGLDLSTISQGSLAGIELYKALTPDKDADAIAGSVNLVTKKAPSTRLLRIDAKGAYAKLNNTAEQYEFSLRYGERFFDDFMGVQVTGNLERRDRSYESTAIEYPNTSNDHSRDANISDFTLQYNNEIRKRGGASLLLDFNTPDGGNIKINNIFNSTDRDYYLATRNYPIGGSVYYNARSVEQKISTFNSSIHGDNNLMGVSVNWGISFAQSIADYPYDFFLNFLEPSDISGSGMKAIPQSLYDGPPESLIPYAYNNFNKAYLYEAYYRGERNIDKEQTVFLNLSKNYTIGDQISGEFKLGSKYRHKNREKNAKEYISAYGMDPYRTMQLVNGAVVPKDYSGSRFTNPLYLDNNKVLVTNFLDPNPVNRSIYGKYALYPIINEDALRQWYNINKNGVDANGQNAEYPRNSEVDGDYYNITERVSGSYIMNTLNWGQNVTFIAGLRAETEANDYASRYSPSPLTGYPAPSGILKDTSATHYETIWLPNFNLSVKPNEEVSIRVAAYKALARPDFNQRINKFIAKNSRPPSSTSANAVTLYIGNPDLASAKAWNYEVNTSYFSNYTGLVSVSAFYKEITDMYHMLNNITTQGNDIISALHIKGWKSPFGINYFDLSYPYNSDKPTKVWGFEFEHQMNFRFLPKGLDGLVLNYNISIVRSETYLLVSKTDTIYKQELPPPFPATPTYVNSLVEKKQKLEGQPEFYGNIALGYDIGKLSARLSLFFQGEFTNTFSADQTDDEIQGKFSRLDLALKYEINDNASVFFNINNLTNTEEKTYKRSKYVNRDLLKSSQKYGLTSDLGVRVSF